MIWYIKYSYNLMTGDNSISQVKISNHSRKGFEVSMNLGPASTMLVRYRSTALIHPLDDQIIRT